MGCAPAPRAPGCGNANVDFAMGIEGTQIAKDAASIILLDDNFTCIVVVAKWRRNVFDSMQRFGQAVASGCPGLTPLDLRHSSQISGIRVQALASSCPGLTSLNPRCCSQISDIRVQVLASGCPGHASLDLRYGSQASDIGVHALAIGCPGLFLVAMAILFRCNPMQQRLNTLTLYMITGQVSSCSKPWAQPMG